jgi:hypothetical protein
LERENLLSKGKGVKKKGKKAEEEREGGKEGKRS